MCDFLGSAWGLGIGGVLQVGGVALLIRGLMKTRRAFDPAWPGLGATIRQGAGSGVRSVRSATAHAVRRLLRRPEPARDATVQLDAAALRVRAALGARVRVDPPWTQLDAIEAAKRVRELVWELESQLLDHIDAEASERDRLLKVEADARRGEQAELRQRLGDLALGGLATEWWAAALIGVGIVVTTVAGVCALYA